MSIGIEGKIILENSSVIASYKSKPKRGGKLSMRAVKIISVTGGMYPVMERHRPQSGPCRASFLPDPHFLLCFTLLPLIDNDSQKTWTCVLLP